MTDDALTIVTGASSNHFRWLLNLLTSLDCYEDAPVVVYDLGLAPAQAARLRTDSRTVRRFPFEQYPPHFGTAADRALPYSWKPVIIHDLLLETSRPVLWLDAGNLVHARLARVRDQLRTIGFYSPISSDTVERWTHPLTLQRLGAAPEILGDQNRNGATVGFGTNDLAREIAVAWRDAVMDPDIIYPAGWSRKIHRSDQAILSVVVAQARRRHAFKPAAEFFDISIHHDGATAELAAHYMVMPAQEAQNQMHQKRHAAREAAKRAAARLERRREKNRGLRGLWRRLRKLARRALPSRTA